MTKKYAENILECLSGKTKELLKAIRDQDGLAAWDARCTLQANSWDLIENKGGKLVLTARGKRVASLLCDP